MKFRYKIKMKKSVYKGSPLHKYSILFEEMENIEKYIGDYIKAGKEDLLKNERLYRTFNFEIKIPMSWNKIIRRLKEIKY